MRCIKFVDHNFVLVLYSTIFKYLVNFYWRLQIRSNIEISLQFYLQINPFPMRMDTLHSDCVFIWHYLGKKIITEERIIREHFNVSETQPLTLKKALWLFQNTPLQRVVRNTKQKNIHIIRLLFNININ
jgi:hypothetical protein